MQRTRDDVPANVREEWNTEAQDAERDALAAVEDWGDVVRDAMNAPGRERIERA